jgi:hypothetical protein
LRETACGNPLFLAENAAESIVDNSWTTSAIAPLKTINYRIFDQPGAGFIDTVGIVS